MAENGNGLNGRVAFVTGAGSGMGRETALALGQAGCVVAATDINRAAAEQTARDIGNSARGYALDVTDSGAVDAAVAQAERDLGPIDCLATFAGIYQVKQAEDISDADWARMFAIQVNGTFHACRAVLRGMVKRKSGAIVTTSSIHALRGQADAAHYAAAKGAILAFTKSIAREKGPLGIRANAIAPGPIDTPMWRGELTGKALEDAKAGRSKVIPMGRLGEAREIAPMVVFLLSPAASYITGACMVLDGGEVMSA
jgi:NAD(P)-dependent dehydrogenase (short-subunit alcohol dehydrogenase family)